MNSDVVVVGGGLAGSTLATVLARSGRKVVILEREAKFKDRVRGENMMPWGVATARRLGVLEDLVAAGGLLAPFFNMYAMGKQTERRPMPQTTPSGESFLNMYHPDLQETLLAVARKSGVEVKRSATVQGISENDGRWSVAFIEDGRPQLVIARLVVGADGRTSQTRAWGGFTVKRDPDNLRIAGALVHGSKVPEDGAYLCMGPGVGSFIVPLGNTRARMYFIYPFATGERKLSGKGKQNDFLQALRSTLAPGEWFDGVEVTGPLAEFEGADRWVTSPSRPGLALIGDAAGATDPSWGSGLSKTLTDVEQLSKRLVETDDWSAAVASYAAAHDDYYIRLHNILSWMTELMWTGGPEADERRARVFPRMQADPTGFPDHAGQGPFGPSDERARRLILGEEL
jgi:2-polyprenyl-6-methoxyphenol hydroxylase-like FAD-dependent oxidoreductase